MRLSILNFGSKQPVNDIDIYLTLLIQDLKFMWEAGVDVYDVYRKEFFKLRVVIFGTINDFLAYDNLLGYSMKGKCACLICEDNKNWMLLEHCKKNICLEHHRY